MTSIDIYSSRFSKKNTPQNYYVYAYLNQNGDPYYIGKGKGSRAWDRHRNTTVPNNNFIVILESNLSEIGAFAIERRLIAWWGRLCNGSGILQNIAKGGPTPGHTSMSIKHRESLSKSLSGRKRQHYSPGTLNTFWITNGTDNKCIHKGDTIPTGWYKGKITKTKPLCGQDNSVYGKSIYNNGLVSRYFFPGSQPEGWIKGRK
jgi:hypothetical protein